MSQDTKYQVFISSTYTDLIDARNAAINTVLESYNFPVGMEMFGADNDEQWTIIKELIDSSDFYILIMGHRYGSISKKDGISFTEKEFDYALEKGVKFMCFVRRDNVATLPHERDEDPVIKEKLSKFRSKVTTDRNCEFWDSVDDLKHKISNSLYKNMRKHGGIGWVRGNQISGQLAEELAKLSEENRKLREENESLKKTTITPRPELIVNVNRINSCELTDDMNIKVSFPILPESNKFTLPEKRIKNVLQSELARIGRTVAVGPSIVWGKRPDEFFEKYNDEIDAITDKQIEAHNLSMQLLQQLKLGLLELEIKVENVGTAISTNVSLEIKVPDFLRVIDNDDKDNDINYYEKKFSSHLIDIETPEARSETFMKDFFSKVDPIIINRNLNIPTVNEKNVTHFVDENNTIHLTAKSLLHSKFELVKNFHLFPVEKGEGMLNIKVICAEYTHPELFEIPIIAK